MSGFETRVYSVYMQVAINFHTNLFYADLFRPFTFDPIQHPPPPPWVRGKGLEQPHLAATSAELNCVQSVADVA